MASASRIGFIQFFSRKWKWPLCRLGIKYTFKLKKINLNIFSFTSQALFRGCKLLQQCFTVLSCFLITEFQDINYLVEWRLSLHYLLALLVSMLLCSTKTGNCNHATMVCDLLKDIWGLSLKFLVVGYFSLKTARGHAHSRPVILLQIVMLSPGVHLVKKSLVPVQKTIGPFIRGKIRRVFNT